MNITLIYRSFTMNVYIRRSDFVKNSTILYNSAQRVNWNEKSRVKLNSVEGAHVPLDY